MYFKIINNRPQTNEIEFNIGDQNKHLLPIMNGLRRIFMADVPSVSIDPLNINIIKNTSPLDDQYIIKRFCHAPMNVDPEQFDAYELKIHHPKDMDRPLVNKEDYPLDIRTDMLKVYKNGKLVQENLFIGNSILFILKPLQEFYMNCKLNYNSPKKSYQETNNKFGSNYQVVTQSAFKYEIDQKRRHDPDYDFIDDERNYLVSNDNPVGFVFKLETVGSDYFKPVHVFNTGLEILNKKLLRAKNAIVNKNEIDYLKIDKDENIDNLEIFIFLKDEDHTLGNILSSKVENIQKRLGDSRENFVAYCIPHQLLNRMEIKIKNDSKKIKLSAEEILVKAIDESMDELVEIKKLFNENYKKDISKK